MAGTFRMVCGIAAAQGVPYYLPVKSSVCVIIYRRNFGGNYCVLVQRRCGTDKAAGYFQRSVDNEGERQYNKL